MPDGMFVTFEGGEGVGKSTQIKYLESSLKTKGYDVVLTREPGGCTAAEDIRNLLFQENHAENWNVEAETLMMFAARAMHIKDVIAPALSAGKTVLCDRYMDSTRVYQGDVKGADLGFISILEQEIIGNYIPDLTFILDLEAQTAMARVNSRGAENHHDCGNLSFYEGLRQGFLNVATENAERCVVIDASKTQEIIADDIGAALEKKLK